MKPTKDLIYFDNNATTPIASEVLDAMIDVYRIGPLNPSSQHSFGHSAKRLLLSAREEIAQSLKIHPDSIIFIGSATEGINQLFHTFNTGHIITTRVEHAAIHELVKNRPNTTFIPVSQQGLLEIKDVKAAITPDTSLLLFSYANGETGTLFPVEELALVAKEYRIPLIVDAVAAFGKTHVSLMDGITGMVFSSHKIHGPTGSAFMYVKPGTKIKPLILGGGQERGLRSGTESVAGVIGTAKAVALLKEEDIYKIERLRDHFETSLTMRVPNIQILGGANRVSNVSNVSFTGIDAESLLIRLDMLGLSASHGSACAAGAMEPSRVLLEMGYPLEVVKSAIRFSLSRLTTKEEIERALIFIEKAVSEQRDFLQA